jgi:uncharacterized Zn-binding protein involved in type VI secretion
MKQVVRLGYKTKRTCSPEGIGPVYQGSPTHLNNSIPIAYLGCNTYAGKIIQAHPKVYINGKNMAMHFGRCSCGFTIQGSNRLFLS